MYIRGFLWKLEVFQLAENFANNGKEPTWGGGVRGLLYRQTHAEKYRFSTTVLLKVDQLRAFYFVIKSDMNTQHGMFD